MKPLLPLGVDASMTQEPFHGNPQHLYTLTLRPALELGLEKQVKKSRPRFCAGPWVLRRCPSHAQGRERSRTTQDREPVELALDLLRVNPEQARWRSTG